MEWISVKNGLPNKQQRVLTRLITGEQVVGWMLWNKWMTDFGMANNAEVTHWTPLPRQPAD